MEAVDKYVVTPEFLDDYHEQLGCIGCHGGKNVSDMEAAHQGLDPKPSSDLDGVCSDCHADVTETYELALHNTTEGIRRGLETLAHPNTYEDNPELLHLYEEDCTSCHASCGDCHVKRPDNMQGGLFGGHVFTTDAPIEETCWGCHGARNAGEYIGNVNGNRTIPDVHYQAEMSCDSCHDISNFHGSGDLETEMYELAEVPACTDCHGDVYTADSEIDAHKNHDETMMSCNVCHSIQNNNCYSCHVQAEGGSSADSRFQFKIGRNLDQDEQRPYEYVTLRHVPNSPEMFDEIQPGLIENFDNVPSWKMSPSHNIQRRTPQNRSCDRCHGNESIFLTEDDLTEGCPEANREVIVDPPAGF